MRIPRHIAIIPDGNRRWAKGGGMEKHEGYEYGLSPGLECLHLAQKAGVEELTYYGFTTDNCKRPQKEVAAFSAACVKAVEMIAQSDVSLLVVGNSESKMFPKELLRYTGERVKFGSGKTRVNFLVNYGWEWDLGQMDTKSNSREAITDSLRSKDISRIDMVVRWGGRKRLSGLLPVQSVYADIFTIEAMWPDFTPSQFEDALRWYDRQEVTLGG